MAVARGTYEIDIDARKAEAGFRNLTKGATPGLEKMSGAINALSGQVGGLGGVVGKSVGTLKQFGEAFLATGPIGLGIAAGVVGVGYLADAWLKSEKAAEDALTRTRETVELVAGDIQKLVDGLDRQLVNILGKAGVDEPTIILEKQRQKVEELKAELADLESTTAVQWARALGGPMMSAQEEFADQLAFTRGRIEEEEMALLAAADAAEEYATKLGIVKRAEGGTTPTKPRTGRGGTSRIPGVTAEITGRESLTSEGLTFAERDERDAKDAIVRAEKKSAMFQKIAENEAKFDADQRRLETEAFNAAEEYKRDQIEETAKAKIEAERRASEAQKQMFVDVAHTYAALMQGAIMQTFDMAMDLTEKMFAREEINAQEVAAAFMKSIGRQLFGIGLTQTFEGAGAVIQGAITNDPKAIAGGVALMSLGGHAMAAGGALAGGGAAMSGMARANAGGAGGGGRASTGVGRRREQGSRDMPSSAVTIVFGAGSAVMGDPTNRALTLDRDAARARQNVWRQ
jgi:hypothetical protein